MERFWKLLGYIWALPLTAIASVYAEAFSLFGWYDWVGVQGDALVWFKTNKTPAWLTKFWAKRGGHAFGQVVVVKYDLSTDRGKVLLAHETEHVHQAMKLGIFHPIMYALIYVSIKLCCESADPFLDHSFEVSARRRAGQVVDVIGALQKLRAASPKQ